MFPGDGSGWGKWRDLTAGRQLPTNRFVGQVKLPQDNLFFITFSGYTMADVEGEVNGMVLVS